MLARARMLGNAILAAAVACASTLREQRDPPRHDSVATFDGLYPAVTGREKGAR